MDSVLRIPLRRYERGKQRTDEEHTLAFTRWIEELGVSPSSVEVDPSAASFKAQMRKDGIRGCETLTML